MKNFSKLMKRPHLGATRVLGYALTLGDYETWDAASLVWHLRLTDQERGALAWAALRSLDHDDALAVAETVLGGAGSDVIRMTVMRAFTQSGISLETAKYVSGLAVLPVLDELVNWEDVTVFTGDELSTEQMDRIRSTHVMGASGDEQFTFVALPETDDVVPRAARLRNLADGERVMGMSGNFYGIAPDHNLLGSGLIANR